MSEIKINMLKGETSIIELASVLGRHYPAEQEELFAILAKAKLGICVTVKSMTPTRSREQESYYRHWCREFARFCGMTPDEMHDEMLMQTFGSRTVSTRMGPRRRPTKRTHDVTKADYGQLIDHMIMTASQMGFDIPPPMRQAEEDDED